MGNRKGNKRIGSATKTYIRLPKIIRKYTDPLVKNRAKTQQSFDQRAKKGKNLIKKKLQLDKVSLRRNKK